MKEGWGEGVERDQYRLLFGKEDGLKSASSLLVSVLSEKRLLGGHHSWNTTHLHTPSAAWHLTPQRAMCILCASPPPSADYLLTKPGLGTIPAGMFLLLLVKFISVAGSEEILQ